jgi:hypothetical protein
MRFGISTVKRIVGTLVVLLAIVGTLGTSASAQEWRYRRHERRARVYYYTTPRTYTYYYTTPRTYYYNQNTWRLRRMERHHHWRDYDRDRR